MKRDEIHEGALTSRTVVRVRFSEVDSMNILWHGHYVQFMEDGREAFGREFGLDYHRIADEGFYIPMVELNIRYHHSLHCDEQAVVETRFIADDAAKIRFDYIISRESNGDICATASTMQVFINKKSGQLELNTPEFIRQWKEKWNIH